MRKTQLRRSVLLAPFVWAYSARAQPAIIPPGLAAPAGQLLAALIRTGRDAAIAAGVRPAPFEVHRALLGFFPDTLLRKVRHAVGNAGTLGVPGLAWSVSDIEAVTLGDVILFRDARDAAGNAELWAHELTHVVQYERWGIDGFAARYAEDHQAVEQEARDNTERFAKWRKDIRT